MTSDEVGWKRIAARIGQKATEKRGAQKVAGLRLGIEKSRLSRYISGDRTPDPILGLQIASAFGVTIDEVAEMAGLAPPADRVAEPRAPYGAQDVLDVPLVAEGVGAGRPTLRVMPGAERPYHFRRDWLARKGWTPEDPDRFGVYRLGTDEVALSMFPTIQPESALLVDLRADRNRVAPRSIWVVHNDGGLVVKRVTAERELLVLESDNPDPEYAPQIVRATSAERGRILEGLVIWYATEVG